MEQSKSAVVYAKEVAQLLGRRPETIRSWAQAGRILPPSIEIGGRRAWKRQDIQKLIDEGDQTWRRPGGGKPSRFGKIAADHARALQAQQAQMKAAQRRSQRRGA